MGSSRGPLKPYSPHVTLPGQAGTRVITWEVAGSSRNLQCAIFGMCEPVGHWDSDYRPRSWVEDLRDQLREQVTPQLPTYWPYFWSPLFPNRLWGLWIRKPRPLWKESREQIQLEKAVELTREQGTVSRSFIFWWTPAVKRTHAYTWGKIYQWFPYPPFWFTASIPMGSIFELLLQCTG